MTLLETFSSSPDAFSVFSLVTTMVGRRETRKHGAHLVVCKASPKLVSAESPNGVNPNYASMPNRPQRSQPTACYLMFWITPSHRVLLNAEWERQQLRPILDGNRHYYTHSKAKVAQFQDKSTRKGMGASRRADDKRRRKERGRGYENRLAKC